MHYSVLTEIVLLPGFQRIDVDELVEEQREGLVQSMIKRHKPEIYREHIEMIKEAAMGARPDFLIAAMDLMRMSKLAEESESLALWSSEFQVLISNALHPQCAESEIDLVNCVTRIWSR